MKRFLVADGRTIRKRRQTMSNTFGEDMNNFLSNGYNTIRDNVVTPILSTFNQFSQNWERYKQNLHAGANQIAEYWNRYKQNFNRGINRITQGWNQFTQNFNRQYPDPKNINYGNNRETRYA